jgi:peptide/nickel transport system ATP-binding protein
VAEIADRVAVMQHGEIVEIGPTAEVLNAPKHPYTQKLIAAVPRMEPRQTVVDVPPLLTARHVVKTFRTGGSLFTKKRVVEAVKNVDLTIGAGETLGVVGESGSGKSTLGRVLIRLIEADGGEVSFAGADFLAASTAKLRALRPQIQMIFQDPYASLNPRRKVGQIIADGMLAHGTKPSDAFARVRELLGLVGLDAGAMDRFPHEFSGGQRQRIGIARALALNPKLLIADEPVSALDVSVQAQVLDLLNDIRRRFNLSMLFITHDLRVAAQVSDRIAVMKLGEIVEMGPTEQIFLRPQHSYTKELLDAVPGKAWIAPTVFARA